MKIENNVLYITWAELIAIRPIDSDCYGNKIVWNDGIPSYSNYYNGVANACSRHIIEVDKLYYEYSEYSLDYCEYGNGYALPALNA